MNVEILLMGTCLCNLFSSQ